MTVVDASALVHLLMAKGSAALLERVEVEECLHAPHLIDAEVLSALRGLEAGRKISADRHAAAFRRFREVRLERYPLEALLDRMWALRKSFNPYDASYVALAEVLDCPLITCDKKLRRGHDAVVEFYG